MDIEALLSLPDPIVIFESESKEIDASVFSLKVAEFEVPPFSPAINFNQHLSTLIIFQQNANYC